MASPSISIKHFCLLFLLLVLVNKSAIASKPEFGEKPLLQGLNLKSNAMAPNRVLVQLKKGLTATKLKALNGRMKASISRSYTGGLQVLTLQPGTNLNKTLAAYRQNPDVEFAEPDFELQLFLTPDDKYFPYQWALQNDGLSDGGVLQGVDADINGPEAWDLVQQNNEVVIAVIDTGVDYTHVDLSASMWRNPNEEINGVDDDFNGYIDDIYGIDTGDNDTDPFDDFGHGTHVAGIIAAQGNNELGVAGVYWKSKILACKMSVSAAFWKTFVSDAIECLDYIYDLKVNKKINIVATNNSWGSVQPSFALKEAIQRQADAGILFIAAAGNSGTSNEIITHYPASYFLPNIIAVAALDRFGRKATFSSYGKSNVHVTAPGLDILSTFPGIRPSTGLQISPQENVYFDDFQGDVSGWQLEGKWQLIDENNNFYWADNSGGDTNTDSNYSLTSPVIDLSVYESSTSRLFLGLFTKYRFNPVSEIVYLEGTSDAGESWETIDTFTDIDLDWNFYHFMIPQLLYTNNFMFRFRLQSLSAADDKRISIDDIGIYTEDFIPTNTDIGSNRYSFKSGTSMATPYVAGLTALVAADNPAKDWKQIKNLVLSGGTPNSELATKTITGRIVRAYDENGVSSLNCENQNVLSRLQPIADSSGMKEVRVNSTVGISVLHIACSEPAGEVSVTILNTDSIITLKDDGLDYDQVEGDGIYSAQVNVSQFTDRIIELKFPDESTISLVKVRNYNSPETQVMVWRKIEGNKLILDDLLMTNIVSPFPIHLYDHPEGFKGIAISENGYVTMHNATHNDFYISFPYNFLLPFSAYDNIVAPFWDSLTVADGGVYWQVIGQSPNREMVIEWRNVAHFELGGEASFQIVFFEDNSNILFNYKDVIFGDEAIDKGATSVVGVQSTGESALHYSVYSPSIFNSTALLWSTTIVPKQSVTTKESGNGAVCGELLILLLLLIVRIVLYKLDTKRSWPLIIYPFR